MRQNLSRGERLTESKLKAVFASGKRFYADILLVLAIPNDLKNARVGFAVAKRSVANNCQKNRIVRLLREIYRKRKLTKSLDLVLMFTGHIKTLEYKALKEIWDEKASYIEKYFKEA